MPTQTITCPECLGKGYIIMLNPHFVKNDYGKTEIHYKNEKVSCPRCGGLGVVQAEIPEFIPKSLRKLVNF